MSSGNTRSSSGLAGRICAALVWCAVFGFVVWHASAMNGYLQRVTAERFPGPDVVLPHEQIPQGTAFDAQTWIRQAEQLVSSDGWRLRQSVHDNAPEGRPIYWSSGWAWWLAGAGELWSGTTGEAFPNAIERAAVWANLPVLLLVLTVLGWFCARRWGALAGAVYVVVLAGHRGFYASFYPGNADHHGMIAASGAGLVLGVLLGGVGWYRGVANGGGLGKWFPADERAVRRMFAWSAVAGATGMWFSAASTIPVLVSLAVAVLLCGRAGGDAVRFSGDAWRWWGRLGGALCLGFYFLEQFPDRLGWRLEVNHPVYALAWAGGAEVLAWLLERRAGGWRAPMGCEWRQLGIAGLAVSAPVVALMAGGTAVFGLTDPFMESVHRNVTELESMGRRIAVLGWGHHAGYVLLQPMLLLAAGAMAWGWRKRPEGALLGTAVLTAVFMLSLGWWQNRWMLIGGGSVALVAVVWCRWVLLFEGWGRVALRVAMVVLLGLVAGRQPWRLWQERQAVAARRDVQTDEARQLLYRDVARIIFADARGGRVLLAAAPDASTSVAYYGDFDSLGTLYWENREGLSRASRVLAAQDEQTAADLARRWGVTHFALFGFDGGGRLYAPDGSAADGAFGPALLSGASNPAWLRPLAYDVPPQFARIESRVRLFAVDFSQIPAEAAYRHGMAAIGYGEFERALGCFAQAASLSPESPAPWMRLGELQLLLGQSAAALQSVLSGIGTLPVTAREQAYLDAAKLFVAKGARAEADALLDQAVRAGSR